MAEEAEEAIVDTVLVDEVSVCHQSLWQVGKEKDPCHLVLLEITMGNNI